MTKDQLINWCSQNTLNCFLYDRNMPGLAATTDQAIIAGRPIAISNNETFRHLLVYLPPYPESSLKQAIETSVQGVKKMQTDWSPENFARKFELMLQTLLTGYPKRKTQEIFFEIPVSKKSFTNKLSKLYKKFTGVFNKNKLKQLRIYKLLFKYEEPI